MPISRPRIGLPLVMVLIPLDPEGGPVIRPVWSQHGAETW